MKVHNIIEEVAIFITSSPQTEQILAFKPSQSAQNHFESLLEKKQETNLDEIENKELEQHLFVEHLMRLVKAKARKQLANLATN
jgi:hypothetical protein